MIDSVTTHFLKIERANFPSQVLKLFTNGNEKLELSYLASITCSIKESTYNLRQANILFSLSENGNDAKLKMFQK